MNTISTWITDRREQLDAEEGAAMVEYGLLIFFIALAVIAVLAALGPQISGMFDDVKTGIENPSSLTTDGSSSTSG
jgi:Flp pilus assembly pilin Flp